MDLYIDDDRKYCVAIFDEGGLENAVGRSGVNINLASKLTGYTIDAYTKAEYDEVLVNQKTTLESLEGIIKTLSSKLSKVGIISVADYLNTKKYVLTDELELNDKEVTSISDAVNLFIEVTHNKEEVEEVVEDNNDLDASVDAEEVIQEQSNEESQDLEEDVSENDTESENHEEKEEA
jgi:N utilization substance protein A